ncbi:DUF6197 family protein [Streptomyces sp. NBC_00063]|uniref:DUF6197 family protein n=1 Tax=Streptomyces sp. NBC_00063 TaxID=2975638 RepID=UPI003D72F62B
MITATAPAPDAELAAASDLLVVEIERYLAARSRATAAPATAHPLVTKTTDELIAEALGSIDRHAAAPPVPPALRPPSRFLRRLPLWALPLTRRTIRQISVAEHLELTALVIEWWGWAQDTERDAKGARCIVGAQRALVALGYGDAATMTAATIRLCDLVGGAYESWNDHPDRTRDQVLNLLRTAAKEARA